MVDTSSDFSVREIWQRISNPFCTSPVFKAINRTHRHIRTIPPIRVRRSTNTYVRVLLTTDCVWTR